MLLFFFLLNQDKSEWTVMIQIIMFYWHLDSWKKTIKRNWSMLPEEQNQLKNQYLTVLPQRQSVFMLESY